MSDDISILQEIDDAMRADKAHRFLKRYGKVLIAGCVGVVVLTAVSAFWKNHLHEVQMKQTHLMLQADSYAKNGRYTDALQLLSEHSEWSEEKSAFVKLQSAELYSKTGPREKAIALLKEVIASPIQMDEAVRDSAVLRLHTLAGGSDFAPADGISRPFSPLVLQTKAAQLLKEGKNKEAANILTSVIKSAPMFAPERDRAMQLLQLTGESVEK